MTGQESVGNSRDPIEVEASDIGRLAGSITKLTIHVGNFYEQAEDYEKSRRFSNRLTIGLLILLLVAVVLNSVVSVQSRNIAASVEENSGRISAISASPQGSAVANRKFTYLVAQCQITSTTLEQLDRCVNTHYKAQYRCGQDKNDDLICTPFRREN